MLTAFMHAVSAVGSAAFYVPVLVILYWCVAPRLAGRAAVLLLLSATLNTLLKLVFHDPRPFWTDPAVEGLAAHSSFGMPSGHAQNGIVAWGFLALRAGRPLPRAGAAVMIVLIGVSRVFLGAHSVWQVLAGWAIGGALLLLALTLGPAVVAWWTRRRALVQAFLSLGGPLLLLAATWGAFQPIEDFRYPAEWRRAILRAGGDIEPLSLTQGAMITGALFGILAGLSIMARRGLPGPAGTVPRGLARLGAGIAGALPLLALNLPFGGPHPAQAFAVQALVALWVVAGAPWTFGRLGLAARSRPELTPAVTRPGDGPPGRPQ
ncbi:phosphatase PAP2 family protein [Actinomadura algeriensis]|uniref:Membrane-associated phospholipid phosphatase n=1 Tax=Actinomadura algeriensis TaxID=1679523 RepID=A0ABR9JXC6_9ACTN|nr:phosphatase PAP2 family protein [Actinomadura algeriensis]MBE1535225.1 membrane-associated phospholipid phosphatase [Actinomadura algeriensis]